MFEVEMINLITQQRFTKIFWNKKNKDNFIRKCSFSKKVKVLGVNDWSTMYD